MTRLESELLKAPGIAHGFFGRDAGASTGIYESLNCGPGSKDAPEAVAENRRRVAAALIPGDEPPQLVSLSQVHSPIVHTLPAWGTEDGKRLEGDAMVTATPGLALGILTADCAPVLLADPRARVIGAAHAASFACPSAAPILELGLRNRRFFVPSNKEGHYRFDLPGYAAHRLTAAGAGSVESLGVCTYPPENGYFSFRRTTHAGEPDYGRQISAIVLTG